ncbi:MAG TPA: hypothetical protein PKD54_03840 [Pirellulaceae bacterium]|nr:hypothetical protein [Pirellulaceae bacterium]
MADRTRYQENIIRNYYENRDAVAIQRAQELVTELYLTTGKKRQQHWKNLKIHLKKLGVSDDVAEQLEQRDNPQEIARLVEQLATKR